VRDNLNYVNTHPFDTHWMTKHLGISVSGVEWVVDREEAIATRNGYKLIE